MKRSDFFLFIKQSIYFFVMLLVLILFIRTEEQFYLNSLFILIILKMGIDFFEKWK